MKTPCKLSRLLLIIIWILVFLNSPKAQTDQDAIMMSKNNFCTGLMYGHSSWNNYWEGTFKSDCVVGLTVGANVGQYAIQRAKTDGAD
jgi:hypothetical protein